MKATTLKLPPQTLISIKFESAAQDKQEREYYT